MKPEAKFKLGDTVILTHRKNIVGTIVAYADTSHDKDDSCYRYLIIFDSSTEGEFKTISEGLFHKWRVEASPNELFYDNNILNYATIQALPYKWADEEDLRITKPKLKTIEELITQLENDIQR